MTYRSVFVLATLFWSTMTGVFIHREILSRADQGDSPIGYEIVVAGIAEPQITRYLVLSSGRRAGFIENRIDPQPDGSFRLSGRSSLDLARGTAPLGEWLATLDLPLEELPIRSEREIWIGPDHRLRHFRLELSAAGFGFSQEGNVEGETLHLRTQIGESVLEEVVDATDHPLVAGQSVAPFEVPADIELGQRWEIVRFHPFTRQKTIYEAEVFDRNSRFPWRGERREVFVIRLRDRERTVEATLYATPEGEVLEQHLPFDIVLQKDPPP